MFAVQGATINENWEVEPHRHHKAQLIYTARGMLRCEVENGLWLVPPQCALWMPGNVLHSARGTGATECYALFVDAAAAGDLPDSCCTLTISPLLRELLLAASRFTPLYDQQGPKAGWRRCCWISWRRRRWKTCTCRSPRTHVSAS
ncbi:AraC-like ligand binding domain [Serratia rubidaea]|uniref:AraC-like ligand binding domain n=1 Tax=Serratia rubidaea TaxID=61652 RepID=A0A3S4H7J1_SERRU|nr:AraC-like ligand binding domain [Serratia rubidaea]